MAITQFFVGRWIARRAPGHELSAWLALAMVQWVVTWAVALAFTLVTRDTAWMVHALERSKFQFTDVFSFLGALSVRRRVRT